LVFAVPVAPPETLAALPKEADEAVCPETPIGIGEIGLYYCDLHQVTDLLARAPRPTINSAASRAS
jgi:predicted phosphoribosyltransferase